MCLLMDNTCHRKRNDYKIDMAIDTFWHESIVHKIGKVLIKARFQGTKEHSTPNDIMSNLHF